MAGERAARVWARIAAAQEGDGPVSVAALCRAAARWLGVDGASVTAVSGLGAREPLFASDELSALLEELQFTTGEGPAADEFGLGSPVLVADLELAAARWPGFVPEAVAAGARAMFAFPLQAGAIRVGVLSLYRAQPGPLTAGELADVLVFAEVRPAAAAGCRLRHQRLAGIPAAGRAVGQPGRGVSGDRDDLGAAGREPGGGARRGCGRTRLPPAPRWAMSPMMW